MNNRVVIRSLVTSEGSLVAMDDGSIAWRPHLGTRVQMKLGAVATVLLALKGPTGSYDVVAVGDATGCVSILTLPRLDIVDKFCIEGGIVRSIYAVSESSGKFLAAAQDGSVWVVGNDVPGRVVHLFTHTGPVTSLRVHGDCILIQSGWNRRTYDWTGETTNVFDGTQHFKLKQTERANRRARILELEQLRNDKVQPLMLDLPAIG